MKPLLILDCDGVILEFIAPFTRWLEDSHGVRLTLTSPRIAGSMTRIADGAPLPDAQFPVLLDDFFAHGLFTQPLVAGVQTALRALADDVETVVLTNIPEQWRALRAQSLARLGLDMPVHANQGPKGQRVAELAADRPAIFVDDMAFHLKSAAQAAPHVGRLQMVADPGLSQLVPHAAEADQRIDDWHAAGRWIRDRFAGATG